MKDVTGFIAQKISGKKQPRQKITHLMSRYAKGFNQPPEFPIWNDVEVCQPEESGTVLGYHESYGVKECYYDSLTGLVVPLLIENPATHWAEMPGGPE